MNQFLSSKGFSLNELMVVIAIIAILASTIYVSFVGASASGRDAKRQADLRNLQVAVEQYKNKYGRYPAAGCGVAEGAWAQESTTCTDYISGITPEFMARLPRDSRASAGTGFAYRTNAAAGTVEAGAVYKIVVDGTIESETVTIGHPFYSCSTDLVVCGTGCTSVAERSYGVWGGFAINATAGGGIDEFAPNVRQLIETNAARDTILLPTSQVICAQP
jgi:prepilin-type N-terminal cleavage/methylation domain-containing protein